MCLGVIIQSVFLYEDRDGSSNGLLVRFCGSRRRVRRTYRVRDPARGYGDIKLEVAVHYRGDLLSKRSEFYLNELQGVPAIIMGLVAYIFLPDRPEMTKFLNEDERRIAVARMNRATSGDTGLVLNRGSISLPQAS